MKLTDDVVAFFKAISHVWIALMSGLLGLVFTVGTVWWPEQNGKILFLALAFLAQLAAAFLIWREQYLEAHRLKEAQKPQLRLVHGLGGSYYFETTGQRSPSLARYQQRLFRVGILNSGKERCLASVSIQRCVPTLEGILLDHRLRFMGRLDANKLPIGSDYVDPHDEPTAYVDVIAEHIFYDGSRCVAIPYEGWEAEFRVAPASFTLTLRVDGGPQSATYDFRCAVEDGALRVAQVPDVPLLAHRTE